MKNAIVDSHSWAIGLRVIFFVISVSTVLSFGQTQPAQRCDLIINTTPGIGADTACLDLLALTSGGTAIQTGNNVTRISDGGLKLCKDAFTVTTGGAADIVFIYDNSGSMWSNTASIDSAANDTSFWYNGGCNGASSATITYQVQDTAYARPPQSLMKTLPLVTDRNCTNYAGDPYNTRGVVIRSAINYLTQKASLSTAGVIGFADVAESPQSPLQLNNAANVAQVLSMVRLDSVPHTYYDPPLQLAKTWLNDSSIIKTKKQAIVFISDGAPESGHDGLNLVDATMPPIYSIFLGKYSTQDTANLKLLSDRSGGLFFRVDASKPAAIQLVMDSIIKTITATNLPQSVAITNSTVGQTSVAVHDTLDANGNLDLALDSIIALKQGLNAISVNVTQGDGTQNTYNFSIQADGPAVGQSSSSLQCFDPPTLVMLNAQGRQDSLYSLTATSYTIQLSRTPSDVGPVVVTATSKDPTKLAGWGDSEFVSLPAGTPAGGMAVYQSPYPFNGLSNSPVQKNGTLETDAGGEILLSWVYPRDPREYATYTLFGNNMLVTQPPTANPPSKNFTTLDSAFSVTLTAGETGAVIHYTLNGSVPDSNSPVYTGPIPITATTTIQAIDTKTNQVPSQVVSFVYTESIAPKVSTPAATPPGPNRDTSYTFTTTPLAVVLSDTTPGATIFYSYDSAAPAAGSNLFVPNSGVLKVYATKPGMYPSDTITLHYNFNAPTQVTVSFPSGTTVPSPRNALVTATPPSNVIFIPINAQGTALPGVADGNIGLGGGTPTNPFVGPVINLEIPGPAEYDFQIFSKYGDFMVSGSGQIDAADISQLSKDPADATKFQARVIWTGRCANGARAGTGVYILRSTIKTLGIDSSTPLSSQSTLVLFGLLRQGSS